MVKNRLTADEYGYTEGEILYRREWWRIIQVFTYIMRFSYQLYSCWNTVDSLPYLQRNTLYRGSILDLTIRSSYQ
jgi:hypothetical protein